MNVIIVHLVTLFVLIIVYMTQPTTRTRVQQNVRIMQSLNVNNQHDYSVILNDNKSSTKSIKEVQVPIGTIAMWPSNDIPTGWLLCDGGPLTSTYQELKDTLGGINTLPNLSGRAVMGVSTNYSRATLHGAVNQRYTQPTHSHILFQTPSKHALIPRNTQVGDINYHPDGPRCVYGDTMSDSFLPTFTEESGGADEKATINVEQPHIIINYIIKY